MGSAIQLWFQSTRQVRTWSWLKKLLLFIFGVVFIISTFLFVTPYGLNIREKLAQTVIVTQHREWAWIFIGAHKRDQMIADLIARNEERGKGELNFGLVHIKHKKLSADQLIKVEDISGPRWKGKKMYVYDSRAIRVVVPSKPLEGERISSMVERTGALAGINGGGFDDPDGLGNGFAPIGFIVSGGDLLYSGYQGSFPQHVVGFDQDGFMVVGKYSTNALKAIHVTEAVSFYPRIIANGERLIKKGDGGSGIQPRTAIGQKADGTIVIVVIDGRQAHSVGATEKEVQELFMNEGVINAGFLDGGASSELVLKDGGLVTKPSSRYGERRLPSALLVFENPEDYEATRVWDGITTIDPGGAYDHPEYLAEQAAKKAKRKKQRIISNQ
ncbi:MAG: phosphodiester glycosidase family protein [Paenibacillaceae bacterium]